jgi:hypothetical protein
MADRPCRRGTGASSCRGCGQADIRTGRSYPSLSLATRGLAGAKQGHKSAGRQQPGAATETFSFKVVIAKNRGRDGGTVGIPRPLDI